jgi:hypothetical protein
MPFHAISCYFMAFHAISCQHPLYLKTLPY